MSELGSGIRGLEAGGGGAGEANTSSNVGTGEGIALPKVGVDLPFKSLLGTASEITLVGSPNEITFSLNSLIARINVAKTWTALQKIDVLGGIEWEDKDGTPVANRRLALIDGLFRARTILNVEGRFISQLSLELIDLVNTVTGLLPNANLANLPVLGTNPASPRQTAIVDSEISTVGLSKILGDVALGDIIKRNGSNWARLARGAVGQFFRSTATDTVYQAIEFTKGGTVLDPNVRNIITWRAPFVCTVTNVRGYRVGGTTASINARKNGTDNHLASDNVIATPNVWDDGGAVQNTGYVAGDKLEIMITVVTGSPTEVAVQVDFTRP